MRFWKDKYMVTNHCVLFFLLYFLFLFQIRHGWQMLGTCQMKGVVRPLASRLPNDWKVEIIVFLYKTTREEVCREEEDKVI